MSVKERKGWDRDEENPVGQVMMHIWVYLNISPFPPIPMKDIVRPPPYMDRCYRSGLLGPWTASNSEYPQRMTLRLGKAALFFAETKVIPHWSLSKKPPT